MIDMSRGLRTYTGTLYVLDEEAGARTIARERESLAEDDEVASPDDEDAVEPCATSGGAARRDEHEVRG